MGIDYQTHVCDLDKYELLYSTKFDSENARWNAVDDFHEHDCMESPSIIEGTYWGNTRFGLANSEIYSAVRKLLTGDQRIAFDHFFGAISDHCQLYSGGWFNDTMKINDIPREHCHETIIAAMNCGSVRTLHAVWKRLDLDEYLTATETCVNEEPQLSSILNFNFESLQVYRDYVAGWGNLIEFAQQSKKGLVIQVAI